jgi:hypothetical protein
MMVMVPLSWEPNRCSAEQLKLSGCYHVSVEAGSNSEFSPGSNFTIIGIEGEEKK